MKLLLLAAPSDAHCIRWANALDAQDNEVHICYVSNHKPRYDELSSNVKLHEMKFKSPLGYYLNKRTLNNLVKSINPDVIHVHYASGYGTLGRLIDSKDKSLLSIYGSDIYDFPYKNKISNVIIKKNLAYYRYIASTSKAMAIQTTKVGKNIDIDDIYITPFGVDTNFFQYKDHLKDNNKLIIGSIKKLEKKYGIEYGIEAIGILINQFKYNNIEYHIYGEGSQKENLIKLTEDLKITENVFFHNRIKNTSVPDKLMSFDLFLAPSILDSESFGVSVVESMAVGVPVIASDVDGFNEVLNYGECGEIVKRKNSHDLAMSILKFYENKQLLEEKRIKAKHRVEELYVWEHNVELVLSIYQIIMENK